MKFVRAPLFYEFVVDHRHENNDLVQTDSKLASRAMIIVVPRFWTRKGRTQLCFDTENNRGSIKKDRYCSVFHWIGWKVDCEILKNSMTCNGITNFILLTWFLLSFIELVSLQFFFFFIKLYLFIKWNLIIFNRASIIKFNSFNNCKLIVQYL